MAKETDIKLFEADGGRHSGLKAQQSIAWGNALRYNKGIAEQARNDVQRRDAMRCVSTNNNEEGFKFIKN